MSEELEAIDAARAAEGLGALHLPSNFSSLGQPEQIFALTDIERTDRGLPPYVGLVASLDKDALEGAEALADPVIPGQAAIRSGALAWGSIEAEDINALSADYIWMYDDGLGSTNIDCTPVHPSGCWGHRDNILWDFSPAGLRGRTLVAGAAECAAATIEHVPMNSYTEIVALLGAAPNSYVYTWAEAEAAGAG
jgi:hypothetical protein